MKHLTEAHEEKIVKDYDKTNTKELEEEKKETTKSGNKELNFDRINLKTNDRQRQARIGQSGKYYCGGSLETSCACCDRQCGPTNGCNCSSCMKLDLECRMLPKGYLVNKEGRSVRIGEI